MLDHGQYTMFMNAQFFVLRGTWKSFLCRKPAFVHPPLKTSRDNRAAMHFLSFSSTCPFGAFRTGVTEWLHRKATWNSGLMLRVWWMQFGVLMLPAPKFTVKLQLNSEAPGEHREHPLSAILGTSVFCCADSVCLQAMIQSMAAHGMDFTTARHPETQEIWQNLAHPGFHRPLSTRQNHMNYRRPQFLVLVTRNLNSSQILFCIEMLKEFTLPWSPGCLLISLTKFVDTCLSSTPWQILTSEDTVLHGSAGVGDVELISFFMGYGVEAASPSFASSKSRTTIPYHCVPCRLIWDL